MNRNDGKPADRSKVNYYRLPDGVASRNHLISVYRSSAKKRGVEWALTKEQATDLFQGRCRYCGTSPSRIYHPPRLLGGYLCNGIDRVNSDEGYTIANTVSCCSRCNEAKNDLTVEEFLSWARRVVVHTMDLTGASPEELEIREAIRDVSVHLQRARRKKV